MPHDTIQEVEIFGLHGRLDIRVSLGPGLNIVYGQNGTGKTTILHFLANLAETDLDRFRYALFESFRVRMSSGNVLELRQIRSSDGIGAIDLTINGEQLATIQPESGVPNAVRNRIREMLGGRPAYLPAFRPVLEAASRGRMTSAVRSDPQFDLEVRSLLEHEQRKEAATVSNTVIDRPGHQQREYINSIAFKTTLCREWFGQFTPVVRFPSLGEVAEELVTELQNANVLVAAADRSAFSSVFEHALKSALSREQHVDSIAVDELLTSIASSLDSLQVAGTSSNEVYNRLSALVHDLSSRPQAHEERTARILRVYDLAFRERVNARNNAFRRIRTFEESVNRFLQQKQLRVDAAAEIVRIRSSRARMIEFEGGKLTSLAVLSSGERHVLTLLFSATHMSAADGILLVDEPELSLHVDWQHLILSELMKQAGQRQVVACTHAPEVTAAHRDSMSPLQVSFGSGR